MIRALHSIGYSYKRPSKTVPASAPSREEKARKVNLMLEEIKALLSKKETEIYVLDESHFSTEPYLVRGWFKKRWPPQNRVQQQAGKSQVLWMLESFFLPPYVPEYNPVEIFWRWIKPKGCGFSAFGGINQLISRFKKYVWHYNNKTLCKSTIVQLQSIR